MKVLESALMDSLKDPVLITILSVVSGLVGLFFGWLAMLTAELPTKKVGERYDRFLVACAAVGMAVVFAGLWYVLLPASPVLFWALEAVDKALSKADAPHLGAKETSGAPSQKEERVQAPPAPPPTPAPRPPRHDWVRNRFLEKCLHFYTPLVHQLGDDLPPDRFEDLFSELFDGLQIINGHISWKDAEEAEYRLRAAVHATIARREAREAYARSVLPIDNGRT